MQLAAPYQQSEGPWPPPFGHPPALPELLVDVVEDVRVLVDVVKRLGAEAEGEGVIHHHLGGATGQVELGNTAWHSTAQQVGTPVPHLQHACEELGLCAHVSIKDDDHPAEELGRSQGHCRVAPGQTAGISLHSSHPHFLSHSSLLLILSLTPCWRSLTNRSRPPRCGASPHR